MSIEVGLGLTGCTLRGLWACALILSLTALQRGVVLSQTVSEDELWQQLQSQQSTVSLRGSRWTWRGDRTVALNASVVIVGPGSIIVATPGNVITGSGGRTASLQLRDVTLFYRSSALNSSASPALPASSGPLPAFSGSSLNLTFSSVSVMAPFRRLASISSFWSAGDLQGALQPKLAGGLGSGPQRLASYSNTATGLAISDMLLLPSDLRPAGADCFVGGVPVTDSPSLRAAMDRPDVTSVFVYQDLLLMPLDFNYSRPVNLTGNNRTLELYGCPGTTINTNYNWTRFSIQVGDGGALSLRGLTFTESPLLNQLFWPRFLAPLLGLVYVGVGGGAAITNATIISPDGSDLRDYLRNYVGGASDVAAAARPVYDALNASLARIESWNLTGADVWPESPGVSAAAAAGSYWRLTDVTVYTRPPDNCLSSGGVQGAIVDSGLRFKQILMDDAISAIRITNDIELLASEWPSEASGPAFGKIFVNRSKEVYACHPVSGARYTIDFGNLGQVVFVFGTLRFRGSLLLTHPRPSHRRAWLYLLIGALSVETNGVILFDGVEIRGNTSSPFTNASDPFWEYQSNCGHHCGGFIPPEGSYLNVSYYDAFIFQYRFNKTEWVAVSQGLNITGSGFWGYTDVGLTWRPDPLTPPPPDAADGGGSKTPVAAIAVPVAVGGSLLIAAIVGLLLWLRRRAARNAAAAAAVPYSAKSELSCSAGGGSGSGGGDPLVPHCQQQVAGGKDGSMPPRGSSVNGIKPRNTATATAGANSTTLSHGMSLQSGSAPTEALIEDMKRAITAHTVLTGTHRNEQITLTELLGEGSFGKVYKGIWRGTSVAVKTMVLPTNMSGKEKREKMAVMETAISSSLSHPNIVQTYTYAVLPVKGDGNQMENKLGAGASLTVDSTGPLAAMSTAMSTTEAQNVHSWEVRLVLEFCDRGSLRDVLHEAVSAAARAKDAAAADIAAAATGGQGNGGEAPQQQQLELQGEEEGDSGPQPAHVQRQTALKPQPLLQLPPPTQVAGAAGSGSGVAGSAVGSSREHCPLGYPEVLDACLDVARAMLHMHSENIVHGDLKARNILLKSGGVGDGRSYVAKVADFGLSLRIDPHETHVSNVYQGTITHMAPEVLLQGKVSKMSDVYAFAILMWETYTAGQAFKGTPRALLGHEVTKMNRRPPFPLDTPFEFQLLACRCWESDPSIRPTFEQIIGDLTRMRAKAAGGQPLGRPTALGPPLSGSVAPPPTAATHRGGEGVLPLSYHNGAGADGDSILTASTAAGEGGLPMVSIAMGGMQQRQQGFGGGAAVVAGAAMMVQNSVTMNSESDNWGLGESTLVNQGLFFVQGVDGSTWASQSADGMNATGPGAFAIGARPPFFGAGGAGAAPPPPRPPPSMPPILESHPAQQQQQ